MPAEFYSPKVDGTGAALFVSFNSKDGAIYFKLQRQTGWNTTTKKGSFKGGASTNLKMSQDEAGAIINAIRTRGATKFYHQFGDSVTSGQFTYFKVGEPPQEKRGFGLTISKAEEKFKIGFTEGSAERLMEYLRFALSHIFSAIYSADKKAFEQRQAENEPSGKKPKREEQAEESNAEGEAQPQDNEL